MTSLERKLLARTVFRGEELELPVAPIEIGPAGPVRLEEIGDHRAKLAPGD